MAPRSLVAALLLTLAARSGPAAAQPSPIDAEPKLDGAITLGAGVLALVLHRLPVDDRADLWQREVLGGLDRAAHDNFSASAAALSDLLLAGALTTPLWLELGRGLDAGTDDRLLVYAETLAVTSLVSAGTKYLVRRPRPYAYSTHPSVAAFARAEGTDARRSFYSGHAALAFAAITAGGYLHAAGTDDRRARAAVWASGATVASATAMLRVRAGKHFYSDVLVGALVGAGAGYLVPRLHHPAGLDLASSEWAALGGGVLLGSLTAHLLPLPTDVKLDLQPLRVDGGGGLALTGLLP
jgi:membrane-associated phospholipid phosphatase